MTFKREHYVFHILTDCTFVRHFSVVQFQRSPPPPKKNRADQVHCFEDIFDRTYRQFGLKRLSPKGTSMAKNTRSEPSRVVIGPAVWSGSGANNNLQTSKGYQKWEHSGCSRHPRLYSDLNQVWHVAAPPDMFLKFEF